MIKKIIIVIGIVMLIGGLIFFSSSNNKIIHPNGNGSEYIIKIINCTDIQGIGTDFLVPLEYAQKGQSFGKKINNTHAKYCWYNPVFLENLNTTYLNNNCNKTNEFFVCSENFKVFYK